MKPHFPSSESNDNQRSSLDNSLSALVPAGAMLVIVALAHGNFLPQRIALPESRYSQQIEGHTAHGELTLPASSIFVIGENPDAETIDLQGKLEDFEPVFVTSPASGMIARVLVEDGQIVKSGDVVAMISNQATTSQDDKKIAAQESAEKAQETVAQQQQELQHKLEREQQLLHEANGRVDRASKRLNDARTLLQRLRNGEKVKHSEVSKIGFGKANKSTFSESTTPTSTKKKAQEKPHEAATTPAKADSNLQDETQQDKVIETPLTPAEERPAAPASPRPTMPGIGIRVGGMPAATNESYVTAKEAEQIARNALQESNEALEQIDKIQARITRYQSSVKKNTDDLHNAASRLEATQRALFNNPPQAQMTPITAPADGAIRPSVALTNNVSEGDKVASITPPQLLLLELHDTAGLWEKLQKDDTFKVEVSLEDNTKVLSDARLIEITPPEKEEPAILRLQVFNPPQGQDSTEENAGNSDISQNIARQFKAGMEAFCQFPAAGSTVIIPRAAILQEKEESSVIVLQPLSENGKEYHAEWREITIKENHQSEASVSGLKRGERIAILTPDDVAILRAHSDITIKTVG